MSLRKFLPCSVLAAFVAVQAQQPAATVVERYRQLLEKNPVEGTALDRLWKSYLDEGRTGELIEQYRGAETFSAQMVLGLLLQKAGKGEDAIAAFERAATIDPANPLPLFSLARIHTDAGRHKLAAEVLTRASTAMPADDPRLAETLIQLGTAWLVSGEFEQATAAWERAATLHPADLDLRRRLAETYAQNHLGTRAIPHLEYVVTHAQAAEKAAALQQLARVHQALGDQDSAISTLEQAMAFTAPGNWLRIELQSQMIRLHQRYHRTAELELRWKTFATENPRDAGALLQLIDLHERLGNMEEQRGWLQKLVALVPKNPDYRWKLARVHLQLDQLDEAAALYDQLLAEQPTNTDFVFERARLDMLRDAAPAARQRVAALLRARPTDEAVRGKALEFYQQNHLTDLVENHLVEDAVSNSPASLTALANFYFAERRDAEAQRVIDRLETSSDSPAARLAVQLQITQLLRGQNQLAAALTVIERTLARHPDSREALMVAGELQAVLGRPSEAQSAFQRALAASKTPAEAAEADQRLFDSLQSTAPRDVPEPPRGFASPAAFDSGNPPPTAETLSAFQKLKEEALAEPSEARWLRLARWSLWLRDRKAAVEATQQAIDANPSSLPAYEMMVKIFSAESAGPAAVSFLAKMAEIDPANRVNYQRRAGQLELQVGRVAEALQTFEALARSAPGNVDALADLALTQQRADRWQDALENWRQVYALSPVSRKKEALSQMLRALERLEQHSQAVELMLRAIDTEADERERFTQFSELITYCGKHDLLDWLRSAFEKRRKLRADDYFTEVALGRILKATGNKAAAFEVLADASYAAPNQAESLPELIREAEDLRKLETAAKLQAQLVRIAPQDRAEPLVKLAELQEKSFDLEGAARTWERIVARYPRDADALTRAADFQGKWGEPARAAELLRKLRALEPTNLRTLSQLASLAMEAGNATEAEACLEEILKVAPPEKPGDPIPIPDLKTESASALQNTYRNLIRQRSGKANMETFTALRAFWTEESVAASASDRELRYRAIRQLAELIRARGDQAGLRTWIARWQQGAASPGEALWALHFAGAAPESLGHLEALMQREPKNARYTNAFLWMVMQAGDFQRLNAWCRHPLRTPAEKDFLLVALGKYVQAHHGAIDPQLVAALAADNSRTRRWQAARIFEARGYLAEAIQLGRRVIDAEGTRIANFAPELAGWYLRTGEIEEARAILGRAIRTPGEAFDAEVFTALHRYWHLLPPGERAAFTESYLASFDPAVFPVHRAIAATLLHGIAGEMSAARADLSRLMALAPMAHLALENVDANPGSRRWSFLLAAGVKLTEWKLEPLAVFLWEHTFGDEALIALDGDGASDVWREVQRRLHGMRIAHALSPQDVEERIEAYERIGPRDGLIQLAEDLENIGAHGRAISVAKRIWELAPENLQNLRNLLSACRSANDQATMEEVLTQVTGGGLLGNEGATLECQLQLADLHDRSGQPERARSLLREIMERSTRDTRFGLRYAQISERWGHHDDAIKAYRRVLAIEPANVTAQLALSSLLEAADDLPGALAALDRSPSTDISARLALLHAKMENAEESLTALDRLPVPQNVWPAISVAATFHEKGERKLARAVIESAIDRNPDPRMRFPLVAKALELLDPADGPGMAARQFLRLRQLTGDAPELLSTYFELAEKHAARLGVAERCAREVETIWADGAGPAAAGMALLVRHVQAGRTDELRSVVERLLQRDDVTEAWLQRVADLLRNAKHHDLAVKVQERLVQVNPRAEDHVLAWAQALREAGRPEEARRILSRLDAVALFDDALAARLASAYAAAGDSARAARYFQQAIRADPVAKSFGTFLDFARLQMANSDFTGALQTLLRAFENPANTDFTAIVTWMRSAGRMADIESEISTFRLTPAQLEQFYRALFAHYESLGDGASALTLLEEHPEIMEPGLPARIRVLAGMTGEFATAAGLLEAFLAASADPPDIRAALADLYTDAGESAMKAGDHTAAAGILREARRLQTGTFEFAARLAILQNQSGDQPGAMQTVQDFMDGCKNPAQLAEARALVTQLKSATVSP